MIGRRATAAGIETKLGNHSFRATKITAYLKNGTIEQRRELCTLDVAQIDPVSYVHR